MNKPTITPPFTREEMEAELREILFMQASQIAHACSDRAAAEFLGFEYDFGPVCTPTESDYQKVDLARFSAHGYMTTAYDYAFQTGQSWGFSESDVQDLISFKGGITPEAVYGPISPFHAPDSRCRHVIDMALGRWNLEWEHGEDLTIRQLALLADMTEAAVRNSLSVEQIRTQGKPAALSPEIAIRWLKGRKGFIETRHEPNDRAAWLTHSKIVLQKTGFASGLRTLLLERQWTPLEIAEEASLPVSQVTDLLEGKVDISDLEALRRVGQAFKTDVPFFVGQAVETALRFEA